MGRVENIVGKGENAGCQYFFLFPQYFQKPSVSGSLIVGIVCLRVKVNKHFLHFPQCFLPYQEHFFCYPGFFSPTNPCI